VHPAYAPLAVLVIALDPLLGHLAGLVQGIWEDGGERGRVRRRAIGRHLVRGHARRRDRPPEERRRVRGCPLRADIDINGFCWVVR